VTEQEATAAGPVNEQLVEDASPGKAVRVTMPVIGCESPVSSEVTVIVQVVWPPL
jgi:hypothetical protein